MTWPVTRDDYQAALLGTEVTLVSVGRLIVRMQRANAAPERIAEKQAGLDRLRDYHAELRTHSQTT